MATHSPVFEQIAALEREMREVKACVDRLPPQNLDAEKGVLGSLLLDPAMCDEVALMVRAEDFYADANQKLFAHLMALHDEGKRIDATLLVERLKQAGDLEAIGGVAYLGEVAQSVPYAANATYYARIVRDKATLRLLIHASAEILRNAYSSTADVTKTVSDAYSSMAEVTEMVSDAQQRVERSIVVPISTFAPEPWDVAGPIQAVVQPAGEGYTATFFDANIAASGDTQQDAIDNLKEMVLLTLEDLEEEPEERLGIEAARQLAVLRKLIKRQG